MTVRSEGRDRETAHAAANSDKLALRKIITRGEPKLRSQVHRLNRDYATLRASIGRDKKAVLGDMAALDRAFKKQIRKLKSAKLHTAAGHNAQRLAVRTLSSMDASVVALRAALAASDPATVRRQLNHASQSLKQGRHLQQQTGHALGFTWHL